MTTLDRWDEVEAIHRPSSAQPPVDQLHRGQLRMAYRFADRHAADLMFVHGLGWFHWDGTRWAEDTRGQATRAVADMLRAAIVEAAQLDPQRRDELIADVRKCETSHGINGVLELASALEPFACIVGDLDPDPYLLNTANGTLDLRTFELSAHDPKNRITKVTRAGYNPEAHSAEWLQFLEQVLPDTEVRDYLQRLVGVSLLGKVVEHIFTIATGTGANGKGTTYSALLWALGDYGHAAESDLFMQAKSNPNAASPALMGLRSKRLVVVSETERDQRLAVALMKNLTGGDLITARPLYGKPVTFQPSHTSLMVTNFLPKVAGDDPAVWRRVRVVPFDVVVPPDQRDGYLGERLELDADAILAWAVRGYRDYLARGGMDEPDAVQVATDEYKRESDAVARFIDETCTVNAHAVAATTELFERWQRWASEDGAEPLSVKKFGQALDGHGYPVVGGTGRNRRNRRGLFLNADESDGPQDGAR